jgi:hypothetical protein
VHKEILLALIRYTLLFLVKTDTEHLDDGYLVDFSWLQLINIADCGPSDKVFLFWKLELTKELFLFFSPLMERTNVSGQSAGGQKGQEVRLSKMLDEDDKTKAPARWCSAKSVDWAYLLRKKSEEVAIGMKSSLQKVLSGSALDSGVGTPKSF